MYAASTLFSQLKNTLWRQLSHSGPYAPLLALYIIGLPLLSLSRIGLLFWQLDRVQATHQLFDVFFQGIRVDCILLGLIALVPLLLSVIFVLFNAWRKWQLFTYIWLIVAITFIILLEAATPGFMAEYGVRPNRLFIEYLKFPHEVLPMLWKGFRIHIVFVTTALMVAILMMTKLSSPWLKQNNQLRYRYYWMALPLAVILTVFSIRSTLGHRPANPALFAMTNDSLVNSIVLNTSYSVLYAIYNLKHENHSSKIYGKLSNQEILEVLKTIRQRTRDKRLQLNDKVLPTLQHQKPSRLRQKPLNIVIVLEESLGATFVKSLGGIATTPELEKLKNEGWWFENLYATGTRSVRGIEAVVSGFPPTPAKSVVKLSLAQGHFTTIASILRDQGYLTEFIYGGESHFDNMRGFFMSNGFQQIVDQKDFTSPSFVGSWGVSDEDLFNRVHQQLMLHHASNKPFFTLVFSSSNHAPFEFPDGRIQLIDKEKHTEKNAVKYADFALGQFFKKAKESRYYKDTIFLVVADHDIRVRGDQLIPIKNFHIPGLILGADIQPKKIKTIASQIDLPTTLLSLAGIETDLPMIGRDISSEPDGLTGRAMMQYNDNYGWMEGDSLVVLRPEKPPTFARYDAASKQLSITKAPFDGPRKVKRALANSLLPEWLYREKRYSSSH